MNEDRSWLIRIAVLFAFGMIALVAKGLDYVEAHVVHLTLFQNGTLLGGIPVKLTSAGGSASCDSDEQASGVTNSRGEFRWVRQVQLPRQLLGRKPPDPIAVCAQVGNQYQLLWNRHSLPSKQNLDLYCDVAGAGVQRCQSVYQTSAVEYLEFVVAVLLTALFARLLWNLRFPLGARLVLVPFLGAAVLAAFLVGIAMPPIVRGSLAGLLAGVLAWVHLRLFVLLKVARTVSKEAENAIPAGDKP